jgi:hypothetical protein
MTGNWGLIITALVIATLGAAIATVLLALLLMYGGGGA